MIQFDSNDVPITRLYHPIRRTNGDLYLYVIQLNQTHPVQHFYRMRLIDEDGDILDKYEIYNLGDDDIVTIIYERDDSRAPPSVQLSPRRRIDFNFRKHFRKHNARKSKKHTRKSKKSTRKSKKHKKSTRKSKKSKKSSRK